MIGGSAAGFYASCLLAQAGRRVQVFEQNESLEPATRTLIVTRRMRELLGPLGEPAVLNEIRRFEIWSDGRSAQVSLRHPDLIIERAKLIRTLADQARSAGAEVILGKRFVGLAPDGARPMLEVERGGEGAREGIPVSVVIGADGALSRVARAAGWPSQKTAPLLQAVVRLPAEYPRDTVRVWFVPEDTPYFYWLIPETGDQGVLGLIGEDGGATKRSLERFLERRGFEPLNYQGARIPLYTGWVPVYRRIGDAHVYLVGDAASQVKVTTVGGIVTGLRGARAVARSILTGDGSGELRSLRRELDLHLLVRRSLHRFSQREYSQVLDLLNPPAYRSLANFHRDEAARVLWRLCHNQPHLLWMGLRGLLTSRGFPSNGRKG
ncbi:MAG TPA: NAD(P)/FAD-dependent oxidoreductase [Candidatus Acidoferrales bacterium]|nr:NAD(P)/FAD-dependent oxidoreductase [Candidatus Acidoferrales bacterium]